MFSFRKTEFNQQFHYHHRQKSILKVQTELSRMFIIKMHTINFMKSLNI